MPGFSGSFRSLIFFLKKHPVAFKKSKYHNLCKSLNNVLNITFEFYLVRSHYLVIIFRQNVIKQFLNLSYMMDR